MADRVGLSMLIFGAVLVVGGVTFAPLERPFAGFAVVIGGGIALAAGFVLLAGPKLGRLFAEAK